MSTRLRDRGRIRNLWDNLKTGFWLVPGVMVLGAFGLAALGLAVDARLTGRAPAELPWWFYVSEADDARDVISTLLSSMITMATLVFSITMVVLTLAASQFGPRLIRNFMANPHTQAVLGTFVMTIVYCLVILSSIGWREAPGPLPFSTVTFALVLTMISVGLLVYFIHTLARSIVSETVIERVGRELDDTLAALEPLAGGEDPNPEHALPEDFERKAAFFGLPRSGYVQAVEYDGIVEAATRCGALVGLYFQPGDYILEGGRTMALYPGDKLTGDLKEAIREAILIGRERTPVQDPEFSIRHLVEIAVRALSPGINDPYTAVAVINQLSASLARLMSRALPPGVFRDDGGDVRLVCPRPSYASLIGIAFDQIRQNGSQHPVVAIHLIEAIGRLADHIRLPVQAEALLLHIEKIRDAAKRQSRDASDCEAVEDRSATAAAAIRGR